MYTGPKSDCWLWSSNSKTMQATCSNVGHNPVQLYWIMELNVNICGLMWPDTFQEHRTLIY